MEPTASTQLACLKYAKECQTHNMALKQRRFTALYCLHITMVEGLGHLEQATKQGYTDTVVTVCRKH